MKNERNSDQNKDMNQVLVFGSVTRPKSNINIYNMDKFWLYGTSSSKMKDEEEEGKSFCSSLTFFVTFLQQEGNKEKNVGFP